MSAKHQNIQRYQGSQACQLAEVPADHNLGILLESAAISLFLPVATDGCSCSTGIGADQISGSYGAGEVGALRQMLTLFSAREDAGVSPRCGCRPAGDLFVGLEVDSECPAGIDSGDLVHGNLEGASDVFDHNFVFAHLNSGKPKEHQGEKHNGQNQGSAEKNSGDAIGCKDAGESQRHGTNDDYREVSRGLSNENLHPTSVAVKRRVCA